MYQHLILSRVLATAPPEGGFICAEGQRVRFGEQCIKHHSESACQPTQGYDIIAGIELSTSRRGSAVLVLVDWQDRAAFQPTLPRHTNLAVIINYKPLPPTRHLTAIFTMSQQIVGDMLLKG